MTQNANSGTAAESGGEGSHEATPQSKQSVDGTEQQTRTCECCGSECLLAGSASPHDLDGDWVTALVGMEEWVPQGHGHVFLCQNCSPSEYLDSCESDPVLVTDGGVEQTAVGHCKADSTDVYIGRGPGGRDMLETPVGQRGWLGNPHTVEDHGREGSIERFRTAFEHRLDNDETFRQAVRQLAGQTLGCWCQRVDDDGPACHGEVIAEHADRLAADEEPEIVTDGGVEQPATQQAPTRVTTETAGDCQNCGEPLDATGLGVQTHCDDCAKEAIRCV